MTLKITKGSDPIQVDQIVVTVYSQPGGGKTSLGFTADNALILDFDEGAYRSGNRGDSVLAKTWSDAAGITPDDLRGYKTIVVDTAGRALDKLSADIIARDPKMGRAGALTLQGFGRLKAEFTAWLKMLRSLGADVVLLAHMDEQKNGDEVTERIDAQGGSKNEIYKCSDAMGRLALRSNKRVLLFSPTDTSFGKNPAGLEPLLVPNFDNNSRFLGDVIRTIKAKLNQMTVEQTDVSAILSAWNQKVSAATSAIALNRLVAEIPTLDLRVQANAKRALWSFAKDHDFAFDKKSGGFVEPEAEGVASAR